MKVSSFLSASLFALLSIQQGAAFAFVSQRRASSSRLWAEDYVPLEGEGKINLKVRDFVSFQGGGQEAHMT
jgi:hypothetical protein